HGDDYRFEFGKAEQLRDGTDIALIATGGLVQEALVAADLLAKNGFEARVLNVHTLQPIDAEAIQRAARDCKRVLSAEDHNINGGLGSAVAECIAEAGIAAPLVRIGMHGYGE